MRDEPVQDVVGILPDGLGNDDRGLGINFGENLHALFLRTDEAVLQFRFVGMGADQLVAEHGHGGGELAFHRFLEGPGEFIGGGAQIAIGDEENGFFGRFFHGGLDNIGSIG